MKQSIEDIIVEVGDIIPGVSSTPLRDIHRADDVESETETPVGLALPLRGLTDALYAGFLEVDAFKGQTVVDLGAGEFIDGYILTREMGADAYVAVEPHFAGSLLDNMRHHVGRELELPLDGLPLIRATVVREDMLGFLKKLPDQSVSVMSSCVDAHILGAGYSHSTSNEIPRTIHSRGAFVCDYDSAIRLLATEGITEETRGMLKVYIKTA